MRATLSSGANLNHEYNWHYKIIIHYVLSRWYYILLVVSHSEYYMHPVFSSLLLTPWFDKHKSALSAV